MKKATQDNKRLVVGISGASGVIYGVRLLEALKKSDVETHVVVSKAGQLTLHQEMGLTLKDVQKLADVYHPVNDIGASIASGSFKTMGMIIAPCSMRTLAEIATGVTSSLMSRAADVVLKERRTLVLMCRESPLHAVHLRNMLTLAEMGVVIAPPLPAFYVCPSSVEELVEHSVGRMLDLFGIETTLVKRWQGVAC